MSVSTEEVRADFQRYIDTKRCFDILYGEVEGGKEADLCVGARLSEYHSVHPSRSGVHQHKDNLIRKLKWNRKTCDTLPKSH